MSDVLTDRIIHSLIENYIYSKWVFEELGCEGLNNLLLAYEDKSAQAIGTFAYSQGPGHEPVIFQGRVNVSYF